MAKENFIPRAVFCFFLMVLIENNHAAVVDVKTKGAKGDGKTDDGPVKSKSIIFTSCSRVYLVSRMESKKSNLKGKFVLTFF